MEVDKTRYPRVADYLTRLPFGLDSYPDCQIRADVYQGVRERFPDMASAPGLPDQVVGFLQGDYRGDWLPEVIGNTLALVVRESCFDCDASYMDYWREDMSRLFQRPLYRMIMNVLSTSFVVMGASRRWSAFHRGSTLKATPIRRIGDRYHVVGTLTYPPELFDETLLSQVTATYQAAFAANHAEDARIVSERMSSTESVFRVSWKA